MIEPAGPDDLETLAELIAAYYAHDAIPFDGVRIRRGLAQLLGDATLGRAWLIRQDGLAVGYVMVGFGCDVEFGGRDATVTDLFVREAWRGKGLGRAALDRVEEYCRAKGVAALHLQVVDGNERALAIYAKRGFTAHRRTPMTKWLG